MGGVSVGGVSVGGASVGGASVGGVSVGGVSVGGVSVEGECGRECWRFNCVDCVEESDVWLCVWEEGMGGMCEISQTQEDRMVIRKRTHNTVCSHRELYMFSCQPANVWLPW